MNSIWCSRGADLVLYQNIHSIVLLRSTVSQLDPSQYQRGFHHHNWACPEPYYSGKLMSCSTDLCRQGHRRCDTTQCSKWKKDSVSCSTCLRPEEKSPLEQWDKYLIFLHSCDFSFACSAYLTWGRASQKKKKKEKLVSLLHKNLAKKVWQLLQTRESLKTREGSAGRNPPRQEPRVLTNTHVAFWLWHWPRHWRGRSQPCCTPWLPSDTARCLSGCWLL